MRRALLLICVLTLVVASCGDDDDALFTTGTAPGEVTTTTAAATTTVSPTSTTLAATPTTAPAVTTTAATPTTSTTTTTVPVTVHPGLPAALSRSVIPMDQIDQGWVVAAYSADTINPFTDGPTVVYLVSPEGDRYEVASYEAGGPQADYVGNLSNDGTHVAVAVYVPGGPSRVVSIDIATGAQRDILTAESGISIGTTLPTGRDVVVLHTTFSPTFDNLEIYRVNGSLFADIINRPSSPGPGLTWLYGLDGTYLLVGEQTGLNVYSNDGTFVRALNTPSGICEPVRWWDATTILAACIPQDVVDASGFYHVLWLIPLDGSPGESLTAAPPVNWELVEFGHANAWRANGQILLQWWGDCAARGIQVRQPGGVGNWLTVEPNGGHWIHAQAGDDLVIHSIDGCGDFSGPVSLIRTDGSLVRTLVPQIAGYRGVISIAGMIPVP